MTVNIDIIQILLIFFLTLNTICSIIALILSVFSTIELKALKKSTHSIEYMPVDPQWSSSDKEIMEFNENNKIVDDFEDPPMDQDELDKVDLSKMI